MSGANRSMLNPVTKVRADKMEKALERYRDLRGNFPHLTGESFRMPTPVHMCLGHLLTF